MWAWFVLYMGACLFVQLFMPEKFANGLTGKAIKKWVKDQTLRHFTRYYVWFGVFWLICRPSLWHTTPIWGVFWLVASLFVLDDYLFGDDDKWKRLWEGVKNTIKWKMDLPPEPIKQRST